MVRENLEMMELEAKLLEFQAWIKTQSHLPQDIGNNFINMIERDQIV